MSLMIPLRILGKHWFKIMLPLSAFGLFYWIWIVPPMYQGYKPDQPIAFSHKVHAGEFGIDCQFCHATAERSSHASIPDTATCMKCHQEAASDSRDIQYIRASYKKGIPLRWKKVYDLPDHVKFSHKPHVSKGIECAACHGPVHTMDKVEVHTTFNMGWCVNCHRENYESTQSHPPGNNATIRLTECSTCHY